MADSLPLGEEIIKGIQDVFRTMLMTELAGRELGTEELVSIDSNLTSMIGLGGGLRGVLAIHCPAAVAKAITAAFLGMEVAELDDDVKDAIGEIANMVAGNLKVSCSALGIAIELAIPTSIVGNSFHVSRISGAQRLLVALRLESGEFWVELMYVLNR
jgi:chemotaxis protein CheX